MSDVLGELRIGFLGAGQMATAMAGGLLRAKVVTPSGLQASDPSPQAREAFRRATDVTPCDDNRAVAAASDVLVLAVKPQHVADVLRNLQGQLGVGKLLISIAAGVPLAKLRAALGPGPRLARVMPNAPCLVGESASGYALDDSATAADAECVARLLRASGRVVSVDEGLLDAVTGLSGSGPAFAFLVIEALADGGVAAGLPRAVALELAAQTLRGAAQMVLETQMHPGELKDRVASPSGTTIAGLQILESRGVRGAMIDAVVAAARRSRELGQGF